MSRWDDDDELIKAAAIAIGCIGGAMLVLLITYFANQ